MSQGFKKWCECCKIMIPYSKNAIKDHENTQRHRQNREKELFQQHMKARKEHKNFDKIDDKFLKKAGIKQRKPEQKKEELENNDWQNPLQRAREAEVAIVHKEEFLNGKVWILEREEDTKKLRFRNSLTGQIKYEKPMGLQLEDYENEEWNKYQIEATKGPSLTREHFVKIGEWQEVKAGEGFFDKNKAEEDLSENDQKSEDEAIKLSNAIQEKNLLNKNEILKEILTHDIQFEKDKKFNERLRELAQQDIELDLQVGIQKKNVQNPPQIKGGMFKKRITNRQTCEKVVLSGDLYE